MRKTAAVEIVNLNKCIKIAEAIFQQIIADPMVQQKFAAEGRMGGYFCDALDRADGTQADIRVLPVGSPNPEKAEKYEKFCQEKVGRLREHPEHRLSRQSRDPANDQYGGGVRGNGRRVALSCLPEHADDIWSCAYLVAVGNLTMDEAVDLLDKFKNEYRQIFFDLNLHGLA